MARITPFKGIRYDPDKAGPLETVVAPPYDIITSEDRNLLYAASPNNVIRIILNRDNDPYSSAADYLRTWLSNGILREDGQPGFYEYRQEFTNPADGIRYSRSGLACALKLEPYSSGIVLPHEETRTKAKEDRLRLMRSTRCNPEPIFGLYEDNERLIGRAISAALNNRPDDITVCTEQDVHRIRRIVDSAAIDAIQRLLAPKKIWIADGHHRYETALAYRDERRAENSGKPGLFDDILVVLTAFNDPGMVVLPTHRLVKNVAAGRLEQLGLQLERYFEADRVTERELPNSMRAESGAHRFGMIGAEGCRVLTLRDEALMDAAAEEHSASWRRLDVSILHTLILDRSLGMPADSLAVTPDIAYTRDRAEASQRVRSGEFQLAFLLNDPSADEVRRVAAEGDKMPAKSTYFYPKLWSGLLFRDLQ